MNERLNPAHVKLFKRYMRVREESKSHAVLSASGSERWLNCLGSVRQIALAPPQPENIYAVQGTHAHTLLEFILKENEALLEMPEARAFKEFIGYTPEMRKAVDVARGFIASEKLRMYKETDSWPELYVEQKVEVKSVGFGTADVILYQPFGLLHVIDYKNGKGVVEAEDNTQGLYYAYGAAEKLGWDFDRIAITIVQPNAAHRLGPIRTWHTTSKRLEEAGFYLRRGAAATKKKNAPLVIGSWCYFCSAKDICPARRTKAEAKIASRFKR